MSLAIRPHTAYVYDTNPAVVGGNIAVGLNISTNSRAIRGQLTPLKPSTVYEDYGVECNAPHEWLCNLEDAEAFRLNVRVTVNNRDFRVAVLPQLWDAETSTSFALCVLEEV